MRANHPVLLSAAVLMAFGILMSGCEPPAAPPSSTSGPPAPPAPPPTGTAAAPTPPAIPGSTASSPSQPAAPLPSAQAAPPPPAVDLTSVEPDVRIAAVDLGKENVAGPAAADAKYGGKVIEVEGVVVSYGGNMKDRRPAGEYVALGKEGDGAMYVKCEFAETDLWKKIARSSQVKVKGHWKPTPNPTIERSMLQNCVFTEIGPNPRKTITAEQLSSEARVNRDQFRGVYTHTHSELLVTGEVASIERAGSFNNICLVLKTSAAPRVLIEQFSGNPEVEAKMKADLPTGTKVKIVGQYNDASSNGKPDLYLLGRIMKDE